MEYDDYELAAIGGHYRRMLRIFWMMILLSVIALLLAACSTADVAGVVNGKEVVVSAPTNVERPHLRDTVRKTDIVCGKEPIAKFGSQKQINQSVQNKFTWGRECKRRAEIGWKVIESEP